MPDKIVSLKRTWWVVRRKRIILINEDYVKDIITISSDEEEQVAVAEIKEGIEKEFGRIKAKFTLLNPD